MQIQVRKLPAEVCKRRGCLEECQMRSSQELEKEPEPRTLHGKSAPSSSGRNSCLRILICLAKLSSCDQGGNAEPKLGRVIQVEVGPFVGRLFVSSLQNVSPRGVRHGLSCFFLTCSRSLGKYRILPLENLNFALKTNLCVNCQ